MPKVGTAKVETLPMDGVTETEARQTKARPMMARATETMGMVVALPKVA